MKHFKIISIFIVVLCSCSDAEKNTTNTTTPYLTPFKIIIESDSTCGTHYQYILTQDSFINVNLKDEYSTSDSIMEETKLLPSVTLNEISNINLDDLIEAKGKSECERKFIITKNGKTKTVYIDYNNPQESICKVISFLNSIAGEKYQLDPCNKK
jgi:hypothetical protein